MAAYGLFGRTTASSSSLLNPPPGSGTTLAGSYIDPVEEKISRGTPAARIGGEQRHRAAHVDVPVQVGAGHRLGDLDLRGEVQHAVEAGVRRQHLADLVHGEPVELDARGDGVGEAGRQVVEHHHLVARLDQGVRDHAADVPGPARHQ